MATKIKEANLSLIRKYDEREVMLGKMRGKLAGRSQHAIQLEANLKARKSNARSGWGWQATLVILLVAANLIFIGNKETFIAVAVKKEIVSLNETTAPMTAEEEALFWTYALYDYDKFKERFGDKAKLTVNHQVAKAKLQEILPKVRDREIVLTVFKYSNPGKVRS